LSAYYQRAKHIKEWGRGLPTGDALHKSIHFDSLTLTQLDTQFQQFQFNCNFF